MMFFEIAAIVLIAVITILVMVNIWKIRGIEKRQVTLSARISDQLAKLNHRLSSVVSTNNKLNIGNMQKLLQKMELLNEKSSRTDERMQNEVDSLRRKVTYLLENDEVFSLILKAKAQEKQAMKLKVIEARVASS